MRGMLGRISQVGYVVGDIRVSMNNLGAPGDRPVVLHRTREMDYCRHRGAHSGAHLSITLACSGDLQIELTSSTTARPLPTGSFSTLGLRPAARGPLDDVLRGARPAYGRSGLPACSDGRIGGEHGRFAYSRQSATLGS
jgi:hypothetical protein